MAPEDITTDLIRDIRENNYDDFALLIETFPEQINFSRKVNGRTILGHAIVAKTPLDSFNALVKAVPDTFECYQVVHGKGVMDAIQSTIKTESVEYVVRLLTTLSKTTPLDLLKHRRTDDIDSNILYSLSLTTAEDPKVGSFIQIAAVLASCYCKDGSPFLNHIYGLSPFVFNPLSLTINTAPPNFNVASTDSGARIIHQLTGRFLSSIAKGVRYPPEISLLISIIQSNCYSDVVTPIVTDNGPLSMLEIVQQYSWRHRKHVKGETLQAVNDLIFLLLAAGSHLSPHVEYDDESIISFWVKSYGYNYFPSLRTTIIRKFIACTLPNSYRVQVQKNYPPALYALEKGNFFTSSSLHSH